MRRRKFIQQIGYTVPAVMLGPSFIRNLLPRETVSGSVIIVGAGAAGLYAAKVLKDAGINVTILEASGLHGGRIRPLYGFGDFVIEIGAEEVHGKGNTTGDPPSFLWSSINAYNPDLLIDDSAFKEFYALSSTTYGIDPPYWDAGLEQAWNFYLNIYTYAGDDILMSDYLFSEFGIDESDPYWPIYESWIGSEWGSSIKRFGMNSIAVSENLWLTGDKNYVLDESYLDLLDTLFFEPVLENIEYNKQVTSVDYSSGSVEVICADGSNYSADKILITVPLTILKGGEINFTPPLPVEKISAIETIGMGAGMKIVLKFSETFWNEDVFYFTFYGNASGGWSPLKPKTGATNNILTLFIMGERAEYLSSLGEAAIDDVLAELDLLFDGAATEKFTDSYIQDWYKEPFIKGAYSFPAPGTYESEIISKRLDLAEPIDCKLFFAGEATNNNHPATVHGALESGARAALEILDCPFTSIQNSITGIDEIEMGVAEHEIFLYLSASNPISFQLKLFDMEGKIISELYNVDNFAGEIELKFPTPQLSSGIYLLEFISSNTKMSKKIFIGEK